ncbi:MAG: HEAT repeat domain-containing protein [Spirochaetales bacterium]|nr:HEAT repeat domain-containing protein [Spirochaetales bacterium]
MVVFTFFSPSLLSATDSLTQHRLNILEYGLNSEVLDLVKQLNEEQNRQFLPQLKTVFEQSQNFEIRQNILNLFLDLKDKTLFEDCQNLLKAPEQIPNSLLLTAVSYLTQLDDQKSTPIFVGLIKNKNKTLMVAAIRALGTLKAKKELPQLLALLKDTNTDDNVKPDIYWALGKIGDPRAVEALNGAFDDSDSDPLTQQVVVKSLGEIGDPRSWSRIEKAFQSNTTSLKAAAIEAMGSYVKTHPAVSTYIEAGLRDSQAPIRLAAAAGEAKLKDVRWKNLLVYRLKHDPDPRVRAACAKALVELPSSDWQPVFLQILDDSSADFVAWKTVLDISLGKRFHGLDAALEKIIHKENQSQLDTYSPLVAQALLAHQSVDNRLLYGLLLLNSKASTRMLALRGFASLKDKNEASVIKKVANTDNDAMVRDLAKSILKSWSITP